MNVEEKIQWKIDQVMKRYTKTELAEFFALDFINKHWPKNWREEE
tara:strand:- start:501 stop:635 length:135 start_codon:yes stop_codon:yes gene_type:complete